MANEIAANVNKKVIQVHIEDVLMSKCGKNQNKICSTDVYVSLCRKSRTLLIFCLKSRNNKPNVKILHHKKNRTNVPHETSADSELRYKSFGISFHSTQLL